MDNKVLMFFKDLLKRKSNIRVKLLGDSITHGVGGDGFKQSGDPIVPGYARNPDGYCWANMLRDYMSEKYGAEVINNACTGTKIEFIIDNFDGLVSKDDDIVICTIGTNNRHYYKKDGPRPDKKDYMSAFYANIQTLNGMFKNAGINVVFVANIPAALSNERDGEDYWRIFYMNDVNDMYKKAAEEFDFLFVSLYDLFVGYCEKEQLTVDSLLCDGLHPNNEGHAAMFRLLSEEFGI